MGDQTWPCTLTPKGSAEDLNGIRKTSVTDMHLQDIIWADARKINSWDWEMSVWGEILVT